MRSFYTPALENIRTIGCAIELVKNEEKTVNYKSYN